MGRSKIGNLLGPWHLGKGADCGHWDSGRDFYFRLQKAVEDAFADNPCIESKDLFAVLDKVPNPPPGCRPPLNSAESHHAGGGRNTFNCPLQPRSIRDNLALVAEELGALNREMVEEAFGSG